MRKTDPGQYNIRIVVREDGTIFIPFATKLRKVSSRMSAWVDVSPSTVRRVIREGLSK